MCNCGKLSLNCIEIEISYLKHIFNTFIQLTATFHHLDNLIQVHVDVRESVVRESALVHQI